MTIGLLVLGMHRSGTSAVAGLLAEAGFCAGVGDDVMPPRADNPAGFFERLSVVAFDDALLASADGSWDLPPVRGAVTGTAEGELERLVGEGLPLVVKDPRICLLLDAWSTESLHPVVVLRNPLEIARSLAARDEMPVPVGLALWEEHLSALLDGLEGRQVLTVTYDAVLEDPQAFVDEATTLLAPELQERVKAWAGRSVDRALRRERASDEDLAAFATARQLALWEHLQTLVGAGQWTSPAELTAQSPSAREVLLSWSGVRAARVAVEQRAHALHLEVDALHAAVAAGADRVAELETAFELVAAKAEEQHAQITELGARLGEVEDLNRLVHEAKDRAEAGHAALLEEHRATAAELAAVKESESFRIGQAVVRPLARLRKR